MLMSEAAARNYCEQLTDAAGMQRLDLFAKMLVEENERQNLVSSGSLPMLWQRHFADSAQLLDYVPRETGLWLDLGTGAGFPGMIVALMRPETEVVLVESRRRRVDWLQRVVDETGLTKCTILGAKLEDVETFPAAVISARAFAPLSRLLLLSARFSTPDSVWLLPKGRSAAQELSEQPTWVRAMFHVEQSRTDPNAGILLGRGAPEVR